jgi:hypothetical protein
MKMLLQLSGLGAALLGLVYYLDWRKRHVKVIDITEWRQRMKKLNVGTK